MNLNEEQDLKEGGRGPAPEGSCVMVSVTAKESNYCAPENKLISVAQTGLRSVNCEFVISHGSYKGVKFFGNINLPVSQQQIQLNDGQITACNIGGSQLKAIAAFAGINLTQFELHMLNGLVVPIRVGLEQNTNSQGRTFLNNTLKHIFAKDSATCAEMKENGFELISKTPLPEVQQQQQAPQQTQQGGYGGYSQQQTQEEDLGPAFPSVATGLDDVPFSNEDNG